MNKKRNQPYLRNRRGCFEELESRVMLDAQPMISELLANNNTGLADSNGNRWDWIELYNAGDESIDMGPQESTPAWKLECGSGSWDFPTGYTLGANEFKVIFAAGDDPSPPPPEIWADFQLDKDGENLKLVNPAGETVWSYSPYPDQETDISYGVGQTLVDGVLVSSGNYFFSTPSPGAANLQSHYNSVEEVNFSTEHGFYTDPFNLSLSTDTSDATIRYTLNGTEPSDNGRVKYIAMMTRYGTVATASSPGHGFLAGDSVRISGADQTAYNGTFTVATTSSNSFTYSVTGSPITPATGVIHAVLNKLQTVSSVTRAGTTATVTTNASHGYTTGNWIIISGADQSAYNGVFQITVTSATQFTYTVSGTPASPATGAITADLDNTLTPTSITRSGSTATVTSAAHGYVTGDMVLISGANQAEYNGYYVITVLSPSLFTYTLSGLPSTPATGLIKMQANCYTYSVPIGITKTSTVRAAAYKKDYIPTEVGTQTYIILADVLTQSSNGAAPAGWPTGPINGQVINYGMDPDIVNNPTWGPQVEAALKSIPTFSIVTDIDNLFNSASGIYVNAYNDGSDWERSASVELINPDGTVGFQIDAGLRIRGGYSRNDYDPKHAFRLFFDSEYGDSQLVYPFFGTEGTDTFKKLDLRCSQNYSWAYSMGGDPIKNAEVRDVVCRDLQGLPGDAHTRSKRFQLYINGQYWGLFEIEERPQADFAATYFGGNDDDYDVIKVDTNGYNIFATNGTINAWQALWTLAQAGLSTNEAYYRVLGKNPDGTRNPAYPVYVDEQNLIDYMINIFYSGNMDAPISNFFSNAYPNNFYAIYNRNGQEGFKFIVHDSEHTFQPANDLVGGTANRTLNFSAGDIFEKSNPQWIHQQMMANPEYRQNFADRVQKFFFNGGIYTPEAVAALYTSRANEISTAIIAESARWGDTQRSTPFTKTDWENAVNIDLNWIAARTAIVLNQLKVTKLRNGTSAPLYPSVIAPSFNQYGGTITPDFQLTMTGQGTIYYSFDGLDPRLPGGAIRSGALSYSSAITLNTSTRVMARSNYNGTWSALSDVQFSVDLSSTIRVSEIMYNPSPATTIEIAAGYTTTDFDYIELNNIGTQSAPLGGLKFSAGIDFTFPTNIPGTSQLFTIIPGQYAVVVANEAAFRSRHPNYAGVIAGVYTGVLDDAGEELELDGPSGVAIQVFSISDGWYDITDGGGFSLTIRNPNQDLSLWSDKDGWRASAAPGGTPNYADTLITPDSIVINEVLAHSDWIYADTIELFNTGDQPIDVSGWYLSDNNENLRKYQIHAGTIIQPGGYFVLTQAANFGIGSGDSGSREGFGLSEYGDDLYLSSPAVFEGVDVAGGYREHVDFGATPNGYSVGLNTNSLGKQDFTLLASPTFGTPNGSNFPGAANSDPYQSPLAINEIMYNPPSASIAEESEDYSTQDFEYIELYNRTSSTINFYPNPYNNLTQNRYYVSGGIGFTFGWLPVYRLGSQISSVLTQEIGATAAWSATGLGAGNTYQVFATFKLNDVLGNTRNLDSTAQYTINYSGGSTTVTINQNDWFGRQLDTDSTLWIDLGSYTFNSTASVVLTRTDSAGQAEDTIAGKVVFRRSGQSDKVFSNPSVNSPFIQSGITSLPAGGYVVLAADKDAFNLRYNNSDGHIHVAGTYSGYLSNAGEEIDIREYLVADADAVNGYIPGYKCESIEYKDGLPDWPESADGYGASLNRLNINQYANDPNNWTAGQVLGTPGAANTGFDATAPLTPANFSTVPSFTPNKITLTWSASADAESSVHHYVIYRNGLPLSTSTTTSYVDTNIATTLGYSYQVSAVNRDGLESAKSTLKTIGIPSLVAVSTPSNTQIRLFFSEQLTPESAQNLSNYAISVGSISSATLSSNGKMVTLVCATMTSGTTYTVTMSNLATVSGNPLPSGDSVTYVYVLTDLVPPTVAITAVTPDPRNSAVSTVTITFSEPVTGFDRNDLTLKRNGGINLLTSSQTITTSDNTTFTLGNLSGITATSGTYVLTLVAGGSNIIDSASKYLAENASDTWTMDASIPSATITSIAPDPRSGPVSQITIAFNEPVSGFNLSDLSLNRNGGGNILTASQTLTSTDNQTWILGNLSTLTGALGNYTIALTASGSGIIDAAGNALSANSSDSWVVQTDSSTPTVTISTVSPNLRNTALSQINIVFSEAVTGLDIADFSLMRYTQSGNNLLNGRQTLATADGVTWTLGNLADITSDAGYYTLSLTATGSEITDLTGTALVTGATQSWTLETTQPTATITDFTTDSQTSTVTSLKIVFSEAVTGFNIADISLKRDGGANLLTGSQTLTTSDNITWTLGNLGGLTGTAGKYILALTSNGAGITDAAGNLLLGNATGIWTALLGTSGDDDIRIVRNPTDPAWAQVFINSDVTPAYVSLIDSAGCWNFAGLAGNDQLIVDFSNGNPLLGAGLMFNGGIHTSGDKLSIKGTTGADNVTLNNSQILFAGMPEIDYYSAEFFAFDLDAGNNSLLIDHTTLSINQDNDISAGADVTIDDGILNLNGNSVTLGSLHMHSGSILNGTLYAEVYNIESGTITAAIAGPGALIKSTTSPANVGIVNNSNTTINSGQLTATSITTGTLTIGAGSKLTIAPIASGALGTLSANSTLSSLAAAKTIIPILVSSAVAAETKIDSINVLVLETNEFAWPVNTQESTPQEQSAIHSIIDSTVLNRLAEARLDTAHSIKRSNSATGQALQDETLFRVLKQSQLKSERLTAATVLQTIQERGNLFIENHHRKMDIIHTHGNSLLAKQLHKAIDDVLSDEDDDISTES